ncbi:MAG: RluA family pseudouridine synthase [Planctomycetes bacterium]|jgi:23S rRNA pseudouridine1911/1915/1917 synthase|nr:RluA family pseudouridine synthase [Planctomycetota bacterium]
MRFLPKHRDLSRPLEKIELIVRASDFRSPVDELVVRLDRFLGEHLTWRSRTSIQELVHDGYVWVDASTPDQPQGSGEAKPETRPGRRLRHGSRVVVWIPEQNRVEVKTGELADLGQDLSVLYEDAAALVVDKPAMLAVHPGGRHLTDTLIQRVHARMGLGDAPRDERPRLCHRLDRETSGIVLLGKTPRAHSLMMKQFEAREVEKEYLAIVRGVPAQDGGRIDLPLGMGRSTRVQLKMTVQADGLESVTEWRVVERFREHALVACKLLTGRQHQIRVHMASIGFPLVGDKLYGPDDAYFEKGMDGTLSADDLRELGLPRHALHNHRLAFTSPDGNRRVEVTSPLPRDLADFVAAQRT